MYFPSQFSTNWLPLSCIFWQRYFLKYTETTNTSLGRLWMHWHNCIYVHTINLLLYLECKQSTELLIIKAGNNKERQTLPTQFALKTRDVHEDWSFSIGASASTAPLTKRWGDVFIFTRGLSGHGLGAQLFSTWLLSALAISPTLRLMASSCYSLATREWRHLRGCRRFSPDIWVVLILAHLLTMGMSSTVPLHSCHSSIGL